MPLHHLRPAPVNAFLANQLLGWEPIHPNIRYPVSFAVHEEGDNLGLYFAPAALGAVAAAAGLPADDVALLRKPGLPHGTVPWGDLSDETGEIEVIHLPRGADIDAALQALPDPILCQPALAVPSQLGSRVTISLNDGCHAVVISPDEAVVQACLTGFVNDYLVAVLGRSAELPDLPGALAGQLITPVAAGAWYGLQLERRKRFWRLALVHHDPDGQSTTTRWVSEGEGGRWRAGWDW